MMKKRMAALLACTAMTAVLAGHITAYAAGGTITTTTVTLNVPGETSYTMTIPTKTTVSGYGWTELASKLKVEGTLAAGKQVEVTIKSENGCKFVNADQSQSIAYTLTQSANGGAVSTLVFQPDDLEDTGKTLGVYVEQNDWNAVPGGSYSDVLTFTAKTANAEN